MIKVNYDAKTTLVKGYYPNAINYTTIPEPFIEISEEQHQEALSKEMCVVDGVFKEYVLPENQQLENAKTTKITEVKAARDSANISPITDIQAELLDSEKNGTGVMSYFKFYTNRHATNPASDPISILSGVILNNSAISYYTQTPDGEDIVVKLTTEIAQALVAKLSSRNDTNYSLCRSSETQINACTTIEELDAININFN